MSQQRQKSQQANYSIKNYLEKLSGYEIKQQLLDKLKHGDDHNKIALINIFNCNDSQLQLDYDY